MLRGIAVEVVTACKCRMYLFDSRPRIVPDGLWLPGFDLQQNGRDAYLLGRGEFVRVGFIVGENLVFGRYRYRSIRLIKLLDQAALFESIANLQLQSSTGFMPLRTDRIAFLDL